MLNKILRSPVTTVVLFVMAAVLLLTGTIGGARAATLIRAEQTYRASLALSSLDVQVTENGEAASEDSLFQNLLGEGETFQIGKDYADTLAAAIPGGESGMGGYVRVTITRYWTQNGEKITTLDPELIELSCDGVKLDYTSADYAEGWVVDTANSTDETIVLYYNTPVQPGYAAVFADTLTISGDVLTSITKTDGEIDYDYDNVSFHVEAVADAVQEHNADKAITSAWGFNFLGVTG